MILLWMYLLPLLRLELDMLVGFVLDGPDARWSSRPRSLYLSSSSRLRLESLRDPSLRLQGGWWRWVVESGSCLEKVQLETVKIGEKTCIKTVTCPSMINIVHTSHLIKIVPHPHVPASI